MQHFSSSITRPDSATVLASAASGFASYAKSEGLDVEELFDQSSLSTDLLADPTQAICLRSFLDMMDRAANVTGNDNFGLWLGNQFQPEHFGHLGYVALSSATVGDALANMIRYFQLFQRQSVLSFKPYRGKLRLEYQLQDASIVSRRHDAELTMGAIMNILKRALGSQWSPEEVHFSHASPEGWREHRKAFRAEALFNQDVNGMVLRSSDLTKAMPGADPQLKMIILQSFKLQHGQNGVESTVSDRVSSAIVELISAGCPRLEDVALRTGVPSWTLSRQLKDEGGSFSSLVESVRKDLAGHYLEKTSMNISKVAEQLGYTETSSFSHAFARWFGVSPKRWRELRRGGLN